MKAKYLPLTARAAELLSRAYAQKRTLDSGKVLEVTIQGETEDDEWVEADIAVTPEILSAAQASLARKISALERQLSEFGVTDLDDLQFEGEDEDEEEDEDEKAT